MIEKIFFSGLRDGIQNRAKICKRRDWFIQETDSKSDRPAVGVVGKLGMGPKYAAGLCSENDSEQDPSAKKKMYCFIRA